MPSKVTMLFKLFPAEVVTVPRDGGSVGSEDGVVLIRQLGLKE